MVSLDGDRLAAATLPLVVAPLLTLGALVAVGSVMDLWVPSTAGLVLFLGSSIALLFLANPMSAASQGRLVSSRPTENSVSVEDGMMPTRLEYRQHYSRGGLLALYVVGCFVVGGAWLLVGTVLSKG